MGKPLVHRGPKLCLQIPKALLPGRPSSISWSWIGTASAMSSIWPCWQCKWWREQLKQVHIFTSWMVHGGSDKSSLEDKEKPLQWKTVFSRSVMKFQNIILWKQSEKDVATCTAHSVSTRTKLFIEIYYKGVNKLYKMLRTFQLNAPFESFRVK